MFGEAERLSFHRRERGLQSFLVVVIGILLGSTAYFTTYIVELVVRWKVDSVQTDHPRPACAWLILSSFILVLMLVAALLTSWAPGGRPGYSAREGGLNGNKVMVHCGRGRSWVKAAGIICCSDWHASRPEGPWCTQGLSSLR